MKTLLTFTMTPTEPMITILAGTLIIAGVAMLIMFHLLHEAGHEREQAIRNAMTWTEEAAKLMKELKSMRSERNVIEDKLTVAKSEIEWQRVRWKQKNESNEYWKGKAEQLATDIEQWKALYLEQLNRANRFEALYTRMTKRPRDPKTGRIISKSKAVIAEEFNDQEYLKLCDEIKQRAAEDITPKPHTLRHGMTVKDPTPEQAREIFEEAKRLGIKVQNPLKLTERHTWIFFGPMTSTILSCRPIADDSDIYVTHSQFLAHMRGEA